jgi:glyoxylase-like metal-dependent hydrolase (beta-lactamase superfamily II)
MMKSRLTAIGWVCLAVFLSCAAPAVAAEQAAAASIWRNSPYEPIDVAMDLIQVSPHAYYVQGPPGTPTDNGGFMSNAGVVITDEGVLVFDALGTPSLAYLLLSKIRAITDKPIVKVVMSHYHADHIYGLQVFKQLGAEIIAPAGAKDYLESPAAEGRLKERRESLFPWVDENTHLVWPDRYISKETHFRLGGLDFVIIPLGSTHSNGDQMLRVVQDGALFAGDLIFQGRVPFVAGAKPKHWMDSLANLDATGLKVIVPGHGAASHDPAEAIKFTYNYLKFLYDNMAHAVDELMTFDEAYNAMDWSPYEKLPAAQANRMNAYFVFLSLENASVE